MIWPSNLVTSTFLNTFHAEEEPRRGRWTRFRFFMVMFAAAFAYCFLPGTSCLEEGGGTWADDGVRVFVYCAVVFLVGVLDQAWSVALRPCAERISDEI
jgi:membrane protein DedA with SNARE-associated domain